ncbi:recombinase family protein [Brevundimonas sp.]|uniref:recombinase family protein n=1 Tax=Brevundimonas sp. TaxID=1871086 RepID=UPI002634F55B|nr:recombinase family protein [Brevundimonas sp.]
MTSVEQTHVGGAVVGYARTSTSDQIAGLEHQIGELEAAGCTRIFSEHVSAIERHRPELEAALDWLRDGDTFIVTKPDRLARSVTDLMSIVEKLRSRRVTVRVLSMHLDTSSPTSMLLLSILGSVSSWERDAMLERQRAGISRAKAQGKYRGRAPTARAKAPEVLRLKAEGKSVPEIVRATGVSRASVYRALNSDF